MKQIWKYPVNPKTVIEMPLGAKILDLQVQDNQPCIWALVDPSQFKVKRSFAAVPTGGDFDDSGLAYVGTFQLPSNGLVFHVFEVTT